MTGVTYKVTADTISVRYTLNTGVATGGGGGTSGLPKAQVEALIEAAQRVVVDRAPSAETVDRINFHAEQAYITDEGVIHEARPQTADFENFIHPNYIGVLAADPDLSAYSVGSWYFNQFTLRPRVVTDLDPIAPGVQKGWTDAVLTELVAGDEIYAGQYPTDSAAARHVEALGDIYYNTQSLTLRRATAVRPGAGAITGYKFARVATSEDLANLNRQLSSLPDNSITPATVSYTHLTLPTICSV